MHFGKKPGFAQRAAGLIPVVLLHVLVGAFILKISTSERKHPERQNELISYVKPIPTPPPPPPPKPKVILIEPKVTIPQQEIKEVVEVPKDVTPKIVADPNPNAPPSPVSTASAQVEVPAVVVAAPPKPAQPKTISSGVEYRTPPAPVYPAQSKRSGEEGTVILRVLVSESGTPTQVTVQTSSGSPRLDEAARQAVLRAHFKPFLEDNNPVSVYVLVPINFKLAQ